MGNAILKDEDDNAAFADELAAGSELMHGQYKIESFLNAGGFGITYSARDSLDRRVVIKECFPGAFCRRSTALVTARSRAHQNELASIVRLFVQEARSLAKLNHPNIVGVHQVFEENNTAYMALDFVEGRDLLDIIEDENDSVTPAQAEHILRKVLDAIAFIHDQGVLHRDISPDNILMDKTGEPVLIDFGAAREEATKKSRVLSALRVVKDGYSPQEFYITGSDQGPYSDLYALGATFYHLLTGEVPPNSQARLSAVASGEGDIYKPLAGRVEGYSSAFLASIDRAMEILPKDRLASAAAWIDMLDGKAAAAPVTRAKPDTTPAAPRKKNTGKRLMLAGVAACALVAMGVVATQTDLLGGDAPSVVVIAPEPVDAPQVAETTATPEPAAAPTPVVTGETDVAPSVVDNPFRIVLSEDTRAVIAAEDDMMGRAVELTLPDLPQPAEPFAGIDAPFAPQTPELGVEVARAEPVDLVRGHIFRLTEPEAAQADVAYDPEVPELLVIVPLPESPGVSQSWSGRLPFRGLFGLGEGATTIYAVNGIEVDSLSQFDAAVERSTPLPEDDFVSLRVRVGTSEADATVQTWDLPVVRHVTLDNGLKFETEMQDGAWITRLASVPAALSLDLKEGDVVVGYIPTSERIESADAIFGLLTREIAAGVTQLNFAVKRDGNIWAINIPLGATAQLTSN